MAKKLGPFRILSCTLSVLATVAFIVACGNGVPDILVDFAQDLGVSENYMNDKIEDVMEQQPEPPQPPPPPSSNSGGEESSDSGPGDTSSSSSEEQQPSSTSPGVSSSSEAASSSAGVPLYTLECNIINSTFPSGKRIEIKDRPEVKCKVIATGAIIPLDENIDAFSWTNDPPWYAPYVGTYDNILVKVSRATEGTKECDKMEIKCKGTITITGTVSSNSTPSSSSKASSNSNTPSSSSKASSNSNTPSSSSKASSSSAGSTNGACGSDGRGNMCLWNGGGACWPIKDQADRNNCGKDAWIFQGGTEGATSACSGGTFICGIDNNPPTAAGSSKGCCRWNNSDKCWDVYSDQQKTDCSGGNNKYWSQACPNKDGGCPN